MHRLERFGAHSWWGLLCRWTASSTLEYHQVQVFRRGSRRAMAWPCWACSSSRVIIMQSWIRLAVCFSLCCTRVIALHCRKAVILESSCPLCIPTGHMKVLWQLPLLGVCYLDCVQDTNSGIWRSTQCHAQPECLRCQGGVSLQWVQRQGHQQFPPASAPGKARTARNWWTLNNGLVGYGWKDGQKSLDSSRMLRLITACTVGMDKM